MGEIEQYYVELTPRHSAAGEVAMFYEEGIRYARTFPMHDASGEYQLTKGLRMKYDFSVNDDQDRLIRAINQILGAHVQLAQRHEESLADLWHFYRSDRIQLEDALDTFIDNLYDWDFDMFSFFSVLITHFFSEPLLTFIFSFA